MSLSLYNVGHNGLDAIFFCNYRKSGDKKLPLTQKRVYNRPKYWMPLKPNLANQLGFLEVT